MWDESLVGARVTLRSQYVDALGRRGMSPYPIRGIVTRVRRGRITVAELGLASTAITLRTIEFRMRYALDPKKEGTDE